MAGGEEVEEVQEIKDAEESEGRATHVRWRNSSGKTGRI